MNDHMNEKFALMHTLAKKVEINFIELGALLSEMKQLKLYTVAGYSQFSDFVETECNLSRSFANRLIAIHNLFIKEMDVDAEVAAELGMEKLQLIRSLVQKADWDEREDWVKKAQEHSVGDLREQVKQAKLEEKQSNLDLKTVFVDQFKEKMTTLFNCSTKEMLFKLALYFQAADLVAVWADVKKAQREFESTLHGEAEE